MKTFGWLILAAAAVYFFLTRKGPGGVPTLAAVGATSGTVALDPEPSAFPVGENTIISTVSPIMPKGIRTVVTPPVNPQPVPQILGGFGSRLLSTTGVVPFTGTPATGKAVANIIGTPIPLPDVSVTPSVVVTPAPAPVLMTARATRFLGPPVKPGVTTYLQ